jgi:hypothetical protein
MKMTWTCTQCGSVDNPDDETKCICGFNVPPPEISATEVRPSKPKIKLEQSAGACIFDFVCGAIPATVFLPMVLLGIIIPSAYTIIALPGFLGIIGLWWTIITTHKQKAPLMKYFQSLMLVCGILSAVIMAFAYQGLSKVALIMAIGIAAKRIYFLVKYA